MNYPNQTYEEATGQIETSSSRLGGQAVDFVSLELKNHDISQNIKPFSVKEVHKEDTTIVQSLSVEKIYNSQKISTDCELVSDKFEILNLSESLEHVCVVVNQEKKKGR